MGLFKTADEELDVEESNIEGRLREFILEDPDEFVDPDSEEENRLTGDKRKLYASVHTCYTRLADTELTGTARAERPRKRSRRLSSAGKRRVDLWWEVMQCDQFIGNGYPTLQHSSSNPGGPPPFATVGQAQPQSLSTSKPRRKRRKKAPKEEYHAANKTLLGLINKNITTMRHLRVTHSKFSNLKESKEVANEEGELALPGPSATLGGPLDLSIFRGSDFDKSGTTDNINPWSRRLDEDCDVGLLEAENCLHWMGEKVLEHAGFQGRYLV
jgi:transcriptional activator SPT7